MTLLSGNVLLTGASGGIGQAIARALAPRSGDLVLSGRRREVLEPLAAELGARVIACDLSLRKEVERLVEEAGQVDVLIANAGVPASGELVALAQDEIDRMLEVNLRAPVALARALAPAMVRRHRGHIVFVSSLQGKAATPLSSVYCASKFGLRGFALALREDLRGHGVGVSVVLPGFTREAGMFADSGAKLPPGVGTRTPEDVARAVISAVDHDRAEVGVAPLSLRLGTAIASVAPALSAAVSRRLGSERIAARIVAGQRDNAQARSDLAHGCSSPAAAGYDRLMQDAAFCRELGQQLRVDSIRASDAAGSGHPTSSMSAADLVAVLLAKHLTYDFGRPDDPRNDHLIFSKGHASPLYYSALKAAGAITDEELLTFRKLGSRLEGHPTPVLPWVDVATGSLGQGLPVGVGVALAGKRLEQMPYRVWVLCGDSEMAEGSMWEAFEHAAQEQLDHLTAIIDVNRLGQTRETMHGWDLDSYADRARAFGWHAIEIDGHDVEEIDGAFSEAAHTEGRPTVIVARTKKGKGASEVEDQPGKHGKPLSDPQKAIEELGGVRSLDVEVAKPEGEGSPRQIDPGQDVQWPRWGPDEEVATRRAYGEALAALGAERADVVALDGEVSNSTYSEIFAKAHPERYFEMYIAEQQMVAAAVGMQVRGFRPFASTFAAFFTRAYDFVRMAAISRAKLCLCGSHAGASIGEDGPSQMALEDLAAFRAVHSSIVLYPSDPNQAAALVRLMADHPGIAYMRTHRGATPTIYSPDDEFEVGGSRVVRSSEDDQVTLVGAGVTLHEALKAADKLGDQGVAARVIDVYSVKPIDEDTLRQAAAETGAIVTVEDHWPEGGLGDAVLAALAEVEDVRLRKLAVSLMPGSGKPAELLHEVGIDADAIVAAAQDLVRAPAGTP